MALAETQPTTQTSQSSEPALTSPASAAPVAASPTSQTPTAPQATGPGDRPEWLPESFWDPKAGLKADDWKNHLQTLSAEAEAARARAAGVPEKADGYELTLPEGVTLPEGIALNADDPRIPAAREILHKAGVPQEVFSQLAAVMVQNDIAMQQAAIAASQEAYDAGLKASFEKLGPNYQARIDAVKQALVGTFGEDHGKVLAEVADGRPVGGKAVIEALEALVSSGTTFNASGRTDGQTGQIANYDKLGFRQKMAARDAVRQATAR